MVRYWLGVVSKEHVKLSVLEGFAQVCHGKKAPLNKLAAGDGFIYYSPKVSMHRTEPCKCFTAIGKIRSGKVYQVEVTPTFQPFRIDVEYYPSQEVPIAALLGRLELTQATSWGMQLRRGLLEITELDFFTIADAMECNGSQNIRGCATTLKK